MTDFDDRICAVFTKAISEIRDKDLLLLYADDFYPSESFRDMLYYNIYLELEKRNLPTDGKMPK